MWRDGLIADGCGQDVLVGEGAGEGGKAWGKAGHAGGQPSLRGDSDLSRAGALRVADTSGGVLNGGGGAGGCGSEVEPGLFLFDIADKLGENVGAGAHEAGADGGDADALGAEFSVQAFGVAGKGEFAGGIRQKVRDGHLAADRRDIDDGGAAAVETFERRLREEIGKGGLCGVKGGEEVVFHRGLEGFDGLVFDGPDLNDAGRVDEDIDALEMTDRTLDHGLGGVGVGEISGKQEEVVGVGDGTGGKQGAAGLFKVRLAARDQDEASAGATVDAGELETEA